MESNKVLASLNDKRLKILTQRGKLYNLLPLLSEITQRNHTSYFKLVKDPHSNRVFDLLIKRILIVTQ